MATSILIFITLVSGYFFLIFTDLCKYRIFAISGWHVHFYAALAGAIFLLLGLPVFFYLVWAPYCSARGGSFRREGRRISFGLDRILCGCATTHCKS